MELVVIQQILNYYINVVFPIFHICSIMLQTKFLYKTWHFHMGYEMGKSLTSRKSAHSFFPGKNRIRKIREKSGYKIFDILEQILFYEHTKMLIYE